MHGGDVEEELEVAVTEGVDDEAVQVDATGGAGGHLDLAVGAHPDPAEVAVERSIGEDAVLLRQIADRGAEDVVAGRRVLGLVAAAADGAVVPDEGVGALLGEPARGEGDRVGRGVVGEGARPDELAGPVGLVGGVVDRERDLDVVRGAGRVAGAGVGIRTAGRVVITAGRVVVAAGEARLVGPVGGRLVARVIGAGRLAAAGLAAVAARSQGPCRPHQHERGHHPAHRRAHKHLPASHSSPRRRTLAGCAGRRHGDPAVSRRCVGRRALARWLRGRARRAVAPVSDEVSQFDGHRRSVV